MQFKTLSKAAKSLNTTVDGMLKLASKGRIAVCIPLPPDVSVFRLRATIADSKGQFPVSRAQEFSYLNISKQNCKYLLTKDTHLSFPIYEGGYLKSPQGDIRYNPIKALVKHLNEKQPFHAWIGLYGYQELPAGSGHLLTMREGILEHLEISRDVLVIAVDELRRFRAELLKLPADEMKRHRHTTNFMIDMNDIAREMYAVAMRNKNIYPLRETVIERILECESFNNWVTHQVSSQQPKYLALAKTAADIIRPEPVKGKGEKHLAPEYGYLSDNFSLLINASETFSSCFEGPVKSHPSKTKVKKWLISTDREEPMKKSTVTDETVHLIWPTSHVRKGRTPGSKDSVTRRRTR